MTLPESISLGPISLHLYGVFIAAGIYVGVKFLEGNVSSFNLKAPLTQDDIWSGLFWAIVPGVIGARLYHVLDLWSYYRQNLTLIPAIWQGGLGIYGAIVGAVIGLFFFALLKTNGTKTTFWIQALTYIDLAALVMPLGQSIGRFGNWVNQELYGVPSNLPWAIFIQPDKRLPGYEAFAYYHPLFFYEAVWNLLTFLILHYLLVKKYNQSFGTGRYIVWYAALYSVGRFLLEYLRIAPWMITTSPIRITTAQAIALVFFILWLVYEKMTQVNHGKN